MIAHPWELRADVTPLEDGALVWQRVSGDLAATADDIVAAARHAMDQGWESEAAESYEAQRRQIVQQIDTFTTVADRIGASLTALAGMLRTAQEELDRVWLTVSSVPHELVGAERVLVQHPVTPADKELVRTATETARAIRGRLQDQLYDEASRLRDARLQLGTVASDLTQVARVSWPVGALGGAGGVDGVGAVAGGPATVVASGSVLDLGGQDPDALAAGGVPAAGAATGGVGGVAAGAVPSLPAIAPISVDMPELSGLSGAALAAGAAGVAGLSAAARRGRRREEPALGTGMAPMGGMAAGAAMRGGGTLGRPGAAGGGARGPKPTLAEQESAEERAARVAREKEAAKEAKRQLIAERQAERAARRAQRAGAGGKPEADEQRPRIEVSEVAPVAAPPPDRG